MFRSSTVLFGYQVNECEFMCGYFGTGLQMDTLTTNKIDLTKKAANSLVMQE